MKVAAGTRLGPYEIVSRIGAGGMGEVWRARDTRLDRSVAVKILIGEFAASSEFRLRFEREARAISQFNHPNICTLYDVSEDYLVVELIEGGEPRRADRSRPAADHRGAQVWHTNEVLRLYRPHAMSRRSREPSG